ncbi:carbohydrate kinase family protein [Georgenia subflava]|uniref:Carbohydrate kinase PfkB domain-containing protein n=1 Tax=Georgenia subflava TaxID=1622177 RepID=A0A6N7EJ98_9MICO|nr:carbohydrate kinase family protein [Georgenia subflava]MPV36266.1 hypothetical protein [Georgenia subflava]
MAGTTVALGHVVLDEIRLADGTALPPVVGGAGAYAAYGQALVAPQVLLASGVGEDFPARADLALAGIDSAALAALDPHTPRTRIQYFTDGEREETPEFGLDHFRRLDPAVWMLPESADPIALYVFDEISPDLFTDIAELRRRTGCAVLWELHAGVCTPEQLPAVRAQAAGVDILSLNRTEARGLCGTDDLERCLAELADIVPTVALRLGAEGALVVHDGETVSARPPAGPVVDPTGAGNAFSGAFVASWAVAGRDAEAALRDAMGASALTIRQYGPPPVDAALREEHRRIAASIDVTTPQLQNGPSL